MRQFHRLRLPVRSHLVLTATVAALLVSPSAAQAANPVEFASKTVNCNSSQSSPTYSTSPVADTHDGFLVKVEATGTGSYQVYSDGAPAYIAGSRSGTQWNSATSQVNAGGVLAGRLYCGSGAAYSVKVTYYNVPTASAQYSGSTDPEDYSALGFRAAGEGPYVADVTVQGGAIQLENRPYGETQTFASSGSYYLGTKQQGAQTLRVNPVDGPQATWTVTIRPLPVSIATPAFPAAFARPGDILRADYSTNGDTTLNANILNSAGQPVRNLASGFAISSGPRSLTWDALGGGGAPLPDGPYVLRLDGQDRNGFGQSAQSAPVTVDGTPPAARPTSPATLPAANAFTVAVADGGSGLDDATLSVDGFRGYDTASSTGALSYRPSGGWEAGSTHTWSVAAEDKVGNKLSTSGAFKVAAPAARKPAAKKPAAKKAVARNCKSVVVTRNSSDYMYKVRALRVSCTTARKALKRWGKSRYRPRKGPRGYKCKSQRVRRFERRSTCKAGKGSKQKVIGFTTGP